MTGRKIIRIAAVTAAILASSASPVLGQPQETEQTLEQPEEPVQTPGQPEEAVQPRPAEGWQLDASQQWIYMENSKKLTSRWLPWPDGTLRYVGRDGHMVRDSWVDAGEVRCRVRQDGSRYENEWFSLVSKPTLPSGRQGTSWYYAGGDGAIRKSGWHELGGKYYYFYSGGSSPRKTFLNLDDRRFYVDQDGARKGPGWFSVDSSDGKGKTFTNWYYAAEDGALLRDGWHRADGRTCYFDSNGTVYRSRWFNLGDDRYYADQDGAVQNGWFSITSTGGGQEHTNWYYAEPNGVVWRNGWREKDGNWYLFEAGGLNYRKRWYTDGNGGKYYLGEDGILQDDGWFRIENTNPSTGAVTESWYYASESGAVLRGGIRELDGRSYYFDSNGVNYRKRWLTQDNGRKQYAGPDGVLYRNQWFVISGLDSRDAEYNHWYYAGPDGYVRMDGWYKIDGKSYCFNSAGIMRTGWLTEEADDDEEEDSYYYCGEDGARACGWQWLEIPASWMDNSAVVDYVQEHGQYAYFYFNRSSGRKKRSPGGRREMRVDGKEYCFDANGIMYTGWVKLSDTSPEIKGYRYFHQQEDETEGTFTEGEKVQGAWLKLDGPSDLGSFGQKEWYYFDRSGKPLCAGRDSYSVEKVRGSYYVFDMYGAAQSGLVEAEGEFYYCKGPEGDRKCVTGKTMLDDGISGSPSRYYFDLKGKGITGIKDGRFYYKGKMQKADSAARYEAFDIPGEGKRLLNSSGKIMKNTKVTDGDGRRWVIGSGGRILVYGSDETAELLAPEAAAAY
jgi:glucan-binding YG repeat protein